MSYLSWIRKKVKNSRLANESSAAPVNTSAPYYYLANSKELNAYPGDWNNVPISYRYVWSKGSAVVGYNTSYILGYGETINDITLNVTAINDNGATTMAAQRK